MKETGTPSSRRSFRGVSLGNVSKLLVAVVLCVVVLSWLIHLEFDSGGQPTGTTTTASSTYSTSQVSSGATPSTTVSDSSSTIQELTRVHLKWALVIVGGYDYHANPELNVVQQFENILRGMGVPYDTFRDDELQQGSLQFGNGTLRYQALVLVPNGPKGSEFVKARYLTSAVATGTNTLIFGTALKAVPELLGLSPSDISAETVSYADVSIQIEKDFADFRAGERHIVGETYHRAIVQKTPSRSTLWATFTWNNSWGVGLLNTTYGLGDVWYLGYIPNQRGMVSPDLAVWRDRGWWALARMATFALNQLSRINVHLLPYREYRGALIFRVDDIWAEGDPMALGYPDNSILDNGWVVDLQINALGANAADYVNPLTGGVVALSPGMPYRFDGRPSATLKHGDFGSHKMICYNSTPDRPYGTTSERPIYDTIKIDFNDNKDFGDDPAIGIWTNFTVPEPGFSENQQFIWTYYDGKLSDPTAVGFAVWSRFDLSTRWNITKLIEYHVKYGWTYSLHGFWHAMTYNYSDGDHFSSWYTWNGTAFSDNETYIRAKLNQALEVMRNTFSSHPDAFNDQGISCPFNTVTAAARDVVNDMFRYMYKAEGGSGGLGIFQFYPYATKGGMPNIHVRGPVSFPLTPETMEFMTTYGAILAKATHAYPSGSPTALGWNIGKYTGVALADIVDAMSFWNGSKSLLERVEQAYWDGERVVVDFYADSSLEGFVWAAPVSIRGKTFGSLKGDAEAGAVSNQDSECIYIRFDRGMGFHHVEIVYGNVES